MDRGSHTVICKLIARSWESGGQTAEASHRISLTCAVKFMNFSWCLRIRTRSLAKTLADFLWETLDRERHTGGVAHKLALFGSLFDVHDNLLFLSDGKS